MTDESTKIDTTCDCDGGDDDVKLTPRRRKGYIPYSTIYESQDEIRKHGYWIPGIPVDATIISVERDNSHTYHIVNPFLYTIQLEHGKYRWQVVKRYKDFSYLSQRLLAHRAIEAIKTPMRRMKNRIEQSMDKDDTDERKTCKVHTPENYELYILKKSVEIGDYSEENVISSPFYNTDEHSRRENSDTLPSFPKIPDSMINAAHMEERRKKLQAWLQGVLNIRINRNYHETAEFLEVSRFSFINELGGKYKESKVKKRPGGNKVYIGIKQCCVRWILPWGKRWLMVKDSYVCYMSLSNEQIRLVLFFDEQFEINAPEYSANARPKELVLSNLQHVLDMKCAREEDTLLWIQIIKTVLEDTGQIWLHKKPFGSSYPPRLESYCQWFVDAKDYWDKASAMMELARDEIFIADWWLCPEVYMRRPMAEGNHWRLDYVLKRQAERGVRIFILIYKEMEMAIGLNSLYSKKYLQNLHPNIKVMRHPDHYVGTGTFFWAHHEKLIIIDQLVAFVGGVDLCYGRWDDSRHVLTDLGSVQFSPRSEQFTMEKEAPEDVRIASNEVEAPKCMQEVHRVTDDIIEGGEKIGERVTTTYSPVPEENTQQTPKRNLREAMQRAMGKIGHRSREPTPSDSLGVQSQTAHYRAGRESVGSDEVESMEISSQDGKRRIKFRNLTAFGDHITPDNNNQKGTVLPAMEPTSRTLMRRVVSNLRPSKSKRRWRMAIDREDVAEEYVVNFVKLQETTVDMSGLQGAGKLWPGKDYVNYIVKDFVDVHEAYNDFINRYETPRMPWHDIHSVVYGEAARDVARHFIQRWNATKTEKLKWDDHYPYLLPKSYDSVRIPKVFLNRDTEKVEVQVLRSVSHWSTLIDKNEDSIQQAYLSLIANAKHYIYIENQFFVSMVNSADVTNEICRALVDRIVRADRNGEVFRVYIMIPLLPGFEGDISSTTYSALIAVLHWTLLSVSKGPHSLLENLKRNNVDHKKYLAFCSLRTHDELCGKLVTELLYIHSKLMIVDDLYTIIGSANINDRSQAGNRDSEICLLVTDKEFVPSHMNGEEYKAGKFAFSLRKRLMEEHLELMENSYHKTGKEISVDDPTSENFFVNIWMKAAHDNTRIYEEVFRCYPTNMVETFPELAVWRGDIPIAQTDPTQAKEKLKNLIGSLVIFPWDFLKKENLTPTIRSKEGLVPSAVFT
ncbi:phospholipase D active site motif domain-containing protein [Ditylenchus destructor]|nr:phospholipase D active site motif domain-containing protein [Ditylenchus destructor]